MLDYFGDQFLVIMGGLMFFVSFGLYYVNEDFILFEDPIELYPMEFLGDMVDALVWLFNYLTGRGYW